MADEKFQSTHPTRECDKDYFSVVEYIEDFNPRTLQESATSLIKASKADYGISIHAPYKRVRQSCSGIGLPSKVFQSTHPTRECDLTSIKSAFTRLSISIHAPYKRVRPLRPENTRLCRRYFNPRTLQESATRCYAL